jgi:O-antigen/teichoic acid export membrane protein
MIPIFAKNQEMKEVRKLAGQTVIYGVGTMVPRFLNYVVLTPLYTYTLSNMADYGVIVELYAWMVLMLVVLTYGMETGFFRFAQRADEERQVYGTALISLMITSSLFIIFSNLFIGDVARFLNYNENRDYIRMFTAIVAIDAFCAIPFARLRKDNRPVLFSVIKIANVLISVSVVVFLINIAPVLYEKGNRLVVAFYNPEYLVGYVFLANLIGSLCTLIMLLPVIFGIRPEFSMNMWKRMFGYSFPLLIGGLAGSINDVLDKILVRRLTTEGDGLAAVGEYGAGYKIAVLMSLFVQMFRFAAEPFFFEKAGKKDAKETYAFVMKHFVITAFTIFLALNLFIHLVQYMIGPIYRESVVVVPIISFAYLLYGVYLNLSVWYKINDKTWYGAAFTTAGALFTVAINWLLIPVYGYMASAWAHVVCYSVMVTLSFIAGRKYYRIEYDVRGFMLYGFIAIALVLFALYFNPGTIGIKLGINIVIIAAFIAMAERRDGTISLFLGRKRD